MPELLELKPSDNNVEAYLFCKEKFDSGLGYLSPACLTIAKDRIGTLYLTTAKDGIGSQMVIWNIKTGHSHLRPGQSNISK